MRTLAHRLSRMRVLAMLVVALALAATPATRTVAAHAQLAGPTLSHQAPVATAPHGAQTSLFSTTMALPCTFCAVTHIGVDRSCRTVTVWGWNYFNGDTLTVTLYSNGTYPGDPLFTPVAWPRSPHYTMASNIVGGYPPHVLLYGYFSTTFDISGLTPNSFTASADDYGWGAAAPEVIWC